MKKIKTPIVILGIAKSGSSAKNLLLKAGYSTENILTFDEKKPADLVTWSDFEKLQIGTLIVSPGISLKSDGLKNLLKKGWQLSSEISLACDFLADEKIIGITGSVAKSTVTSLVGQAILADDPNGFVGGNLGIPFSEYALRVLNGSPRAKWIVLELSSYQLENCKGLQLYSSAITYLSANHLERYESIDEYYLTKCHISQITKNICVLNSQSEDILKYQKYIACITKMTSAKIFKNTELLEKVKLIGEHNKDNFCIAYELVQNAGLSQTATNAMVGFSGLEHRLEFVAEKNGVIYINDSKATAMDSVLVAVKASLEKVKSESHLYLLIGGKDKNLPWDDLAGLVQNNKIKIIYFGECGKLAQIKMMAFKSKYYSTLGAAFDSLKDLVQKKDVVLLSPGGTSLDEFKNFEDRGNFFKQKVESI